MVGFFRGRQIKPWSPTETNCYDIAQCNISERWCVSTKNRRSPSASMRIKLDHPNLATQKKLKRRSFIWEKGLVSVRWKFDILMYISILFSCLCSDTRFWRFKDYSDRLFSFATLSQEIRGVTFDEFREQVVFGWWWLCSSLRIWWKVGLLDAHLQSFGHIFLPLCFCLKSLEITEWLLKLVQKSLWNAVDAASLVENTSGSHHPKSNSQLIPFFLRFDPSSWNGWLLSLWESLWSLWRIQLKRRFLVSLAGLCLDENVPEEVSLQILAEEWVDKQLMSICRTMWDGMRVRGRNKQHELLCWLFTTVWQWWGSAGCVCLCSVVL